MQAFISYSHKDARALEQLHVHLANLRRAGLIDTWHDRLIPAGYNIEDAIDRELEVAQIFLMLVSPDFIASDYCIGREMARALERRSEGAIVVPIIIEPCDWKSMPISRLKALPYDGKPISEFTNPNTAFLQVVDGLRSLIEAELAREQAAPSATPAALWDLVPESGKPRAYRIKRSFTSIDRSDYADQAYSEIRAYFEAATAEIREITDIQARFSDYGPMSFGCAVINQSFSSGRADITVHRGAGQYLGDIYYSFSENAPPNSMNGGFNVANDEYQQFLTASFSMSRRSEQDRSLSPQEAAELLWNDFIEQAGLSVAH